MNLAWKIFRTVVSVLLLMAVLIPTAIYVLLSLDGVQRTVKDVASSELSRILGAEVNIGRIAIHPFNRLGIEEMSLVLNSSDTVASISNVSARFELYHFIRTGEFVLDYALVAGASIHISRPEPGAPLNISPILEHLRSDKPKEDKPFELKINTVLLRNTSLTYDVVSAPMPAEGHFDPGHLNISDLALNAYIPHLSNDGYSFQIDHLSFEEQSGFSLKKLEAIAEISPKAIAVKRLSIDLDDSHLAFKPIELSYNSLSDLRDALYSKRLSLSTSSDSRISLSDLSPFVPAFAQTDLAFSFSLEAEGNLNEITLERLLLRDTDSGSISLNMTASASRLTSPDSLHYNVSNCSMLLDGQELSHHLASIVKPDVTNAINRIPLTAIHFNAEGSTERGLLNLRTDGKGGALRVNGSYHRYGAATNVSASLEMENLNLGMLTDDTRLGTCGATAQVSAVVGRQIASANANAQISDIQFNGHNYSDISASLRLHSRQQAEINLSINDPSASLLAYAFYDARSGKPAIGATASLSNVNLYSLGLDKSHQGYRAGAKLTAELSGNDIDSMEGEINIFDISWLDARRQGLRMPKIRICARPHDPVPSLSIESGIISGSINGPYSLSTLPATAKTMAAHFVPSVFKETANDLRSDKPNDFKFDFTLHPSDEISRFFNLPISVVYDASLSGIVSTSRQKSSLSIDAPFLRQGNKIIEGSSVYALLDVPADESMIYVTTQFPTKKGDMALSSLIKALDNRIDTRIDWLIDRSIPINGSFDFSTEIRSLTAGHTDAVVPVDATVNFNPGTINFGDETWEIKSSAINVRPEFISVDGFGLESDTQRIAIDGRIGTAATDSVVIALENIALLPIFETLEIDKAMIGGRATGRFTARNFFGSDPELICPHLHVDAIGYNRCTIGDADILAKWVNSRKAFFLDADITGPENKRSRITGDIYPMDEALDIDFTANEVPVGFLKPFMEAFTSDISGFASGHCRLFGTFKEIDLEGDVFADNVRMKIDFTNTSYIATDSVHIRPGLIMLDNISIRDTEGHSARLNGIVEHTFFKQPVFKFDISDAHDFLSFNGTSRENPDWYGTIYGNGGASISGEPGVVNINVNMSTAPHSNFTFVLSDRLDAEDYSFINFRDVTPDSLRAPVKNSSDVPEIVLALQQGLANAGQDEPSAYNMDIRIGINKDAKMTLVMDPTAGDEIKAVGEGNLRMTYHSVDNDLAMWGTYTVDEGSYRFTLQDIIIKDFIIKEGSEIKFDGDPYGVKTNLEAYYATNANLSDLDESFLQDKDLNRTNVPVHALMKVNGDIRQPEIKFDLEFPTLTQDTYRKVRSIVSTEDMMNRQIIYLLALNRFYTPDYMTSTTKGSELFSVASSTISSQLSSMLGKLSENWSIAPNLRSDRGDFSDIEVDVALSSRLLNNRLLFNGNFGYRDKSLNSNQFIGDFDIEYLLNKRGSWRLKAYNRYNDRNYYIRTAQTTQGIGIIFRRDFDSMLSFLRRRHTPADTTQEKPAEGELLKK